MIELKEDSKWNSTIYEKFTFNSDIDFNVKDENLGSFLELSNKLFPNNSINMN